MPRRFGASTISRLRRLASLNAREPQAPQRPRAWTDWYRFAGDELGYEHDERVQYANLRYVEEQNRESLRRGWGSAS